MDSDKTEKQIPGSPYITNDEYAVSSDTRDGDQKDDPQERLRRAVATSYRLLRPYRKTIYELTREYSGSFYGLDSQASYKSVKYVNLLKQAVSAYMTLLASNRPRTLVTTTTPMFEPFARHFQEAINNMLEGIDIEQTLGQWVRDAFFWIGIIKVHMADVGEVEIESDLRMDPGKPFASNIVLDDFFWDTNAKRWSEVRFCGDVYRLPVETLKNSGIYSGPELDNVVATSKYGVAEEKLSDISLGYETDDDELEPMADVADIWLPREGKVKTYLVRQRVELQLEGNAIAEYEWKGSNLGPYKLLHFDEVSENVMPCSTAADLYPLDKLINNIYTKQAKKAKRAKVNPAYTPAGSDTARKIKNASDGEWVEVQDPREINSVASGGVDPGLQGFMLNSMEVFDRMAGNLQAMMGLGPQSDTVGQEKLVHQSASRRESQLQTRVLHATTRLVEDLAYLLWDDSHTTIPNRVELDPELNISFDDTWVPDDREGGYKDYKLEIDVYSMQYQGPGERITKINQLLQQIYLPLMPFIQQQGGTIDLAKLTELHSEMLDLPRLKQVVMFNAPPDGGGQQQDNPMKSPVSNRNYTRRNVSENGQEGGPDAGQWLKQTNQPQT